MKKVTMEVEETLKYTREIILEIPDDMDEKELEKLCTQMERNDNLSDALYTLKRAGVQVHKYDQDMSCPEPSRVEVIEFNIEGT